MIPEAALGRFEPWLRRDVDVAEFVSVLVHDLRNPLASLQGCAQTLVERDAGLSTGQRTQLAEVIAKQSMRLDHLVQAAAALVRELRDPPEVVDLREVLTSIAQASDASVDAEDAGIIVGAESRVRLAIATAVAALGGQAATIRVVGRNVIEVVGRERDVEGGGRRWKLDAVSRLLQADAGELSVAFDRDGLRARLTFGEAGSGGRT